MSLLLSPPAMIFMKVGFHGDEALKEIVKRKANEEEVASVIFWGYGGTLCHPTNSIRPFAKMCERQGLSISVVMASTPSKFRVPSVIAKEFSEDGVSWHVLPRGVKVMASRYALIMKDLKVADVEIDLSSYVVARGPNEGKRFSEYIQGRIDKGCALYEKQTAPRRDIRVAFTGVLVSPYAVFVR